VRYNGPVDAAAARREGILRALAAAPGLTHTELAAAVGLPVRHLAALLWALEEDGAVVHEGRRWYPAPGGSI
jgi:DNA-binding IclR family transcriptional regulator